MAQHQIEATSQHAAEVRLEDEIQRRQLRWFFIITLTLWTLTAIVVPVVTFYLTKNPLSFSLFSTLLPPIYLWYRFAKYLFPMDDKWFELEKLKIQARMQHRVDRQQK